MKRFKAIRARLGCFCFGHSFELIQKLPVGNARLLGCSRCERLFHHCDWGSVTETVPWSGGLTEVYRNHLPWFSPWLTYYDERKTEQVRTVRTVRSVGTEEAWRPWDDKGKRFTRDQLVKLRSQLDSLPSRFFGVTVPTTPEEAEALRKRREETARLINEAITGGTEL